jgi:hypothetical protein
MACTRCTNVIIPNALIQNIYLLELQKRIAKTPNKKADLISLDWLWVDFQLAMWHDHILENFQRRKYGAFALVQYLIMPSAKNIELPNGAYNKSGAV